MLKGKKKTVQVQKKSKEELKKEDKTPLWNKIATLQMEAFGLPDQKVKKYFDLLMENDKMLCLKPKTQASAVISFLESSLQTLRNFKFELEIAKNGMVEIKKL